MSSLFRDHDNEDERIRKVFRDKKLEERIHEHAKSIHEYRQKNRRMEKIDNDLEVAKVNLKKVGSALLQKKCPSLFSQTLISLYFN